MQMWVWGEGTSLCSAHILPSTPQSCSKDILTPTPQLAWSSPIIPGAVEHLLLRRDIRSSSQCRLQRTPGQYLSAGQGQQDGSRVLQRGRDGSTAAPAPSWLAGACRGTMERGSGSEGSPTAASQDSARLHPHSGDSPNRDVVTNKALTSPLCLSRWQEPAVGLSLLPPHAVQDEARPKLAPAGRRYVLQASVSKAGGPAAQGSALRSPRHSPCHCRGHRRRTRWELQAWCSFPRSPSPLDRAHPCGRS